jgi:hypothetical protein
MEEDNPKRSTDKTKQEEELKAKQEEELKAKQEEELKAKQEEELKVLTEKLKAAAQLDWKKSFVLDLLDKQYRLYSWADAKTSSLITTNSILLAVIGFVFSSCLNDTLSLIAVSIAMLANSLSLFLALLQVWPQGSSGRAKHDRPNIRALSGILSFRNWQEYSREVILAEELRCIEDGTRQVYGMAFNVDKSRKTTKTGIRLTLIGIIFIVITVAGVGFASNDIHILGKLGQQEVPASNVEPTIRPTIKPIIEPTIKPTIEPTSVDTSLN